ncbi:MAG: hypothetical protein OCD02_14875 [Spirochaetaceae bacterium]
MKQLSTLLLILIVLTGCDNSGDSNNSNDLDALTSIVKNPVNYTGINVVNNSDKVITLYLGNIDNNPYDMYKETATIQPGDSEIIIPNDMQLVDLILQEYGESTYYTIPNGNRTDEKYIFKSDGSYEFIITYTTLFRYNFNFYFEPNSITSTTFDPSIESDILAPEIHLINPEFSKNDISVSKGNIYVPYTGSTYVYGHYKIKNNSTNSYKFVKLYYNFIDYDGNKAFDEDKYTYIDGEGTQLSGEIGFNTYTCLTPNSEAYFFIINDLEIGESNIQTEDVAGITILFEPGTPETLSPVSPNVVISNELINNEIEWTVQNGITENVMFTGGALWENSEGFYVDYSDVFEIILPGITHSESENYRRYDGELTLSATYLDWDKTSVSPNIQSRSIIIKDEIYMLELEKNRTDSIDLLKSSI